jgi:phage terminase large subunit (gpA)|nr:MAG TPA: terminase large subunit [Caudoviricetes sp.]
MSVIKSFLKGFKINDIMTVTEWAEKYRYLSSEISAEGGLYRVSRTPYFKDIMDDLSENSPISQVVVMMGAQLGKSEAGNNFLGYVCDRLGGSVMVVQPTEDAVKKFLRQRIDPMIRNCESLSDKFKKNDLVKKVDNTTQKDFIGGTLTFAYSTSASTLASTPVKFLFLDEVDRFTSDVGNEGNPVNLAIRRTSTFVDKKIFMVSTPTLEHKSNIYNEYLKGDQRHFMLTCPKCNDDRLELSKDNFHYTFNNEKNIAEDIHFSCPICGYKIYENEKYQLVKNGRWVPTASFNGNIRSYYLNSAYSLLGYDWRQLAEENEEAKNDDDKFKTVENTLWGLPYKENVIDTMEGQEIYEIRRKLNDVYSENYINDDIIYINMTVDTQDNRMCYLITAYNNKNERYVLKYGEIYEEVGGDKIFGILDNISESKFYYKNSKQYLTISKILVDTGGHFTEEICDQVNKRDSRWVAIKGRNDGSIYRESDNKYLSTDQYGLPYPKSKKLVLLNVLNGKKQVLNSLKLDTFGKNFIHLNPEKFDISFFDMLASEIIIRKRSNGLYKDEFKKVRDRNEALDLLCYSYCDVKSAGVLDLSDDNVEKYKRLNSKFDGDSENYHSKNKQVLKSVNFDDF